MSDSIIIFDRVGPYPYKVAVPVDGCYHVVSWCPSRAEAEKDAKRGDVEPE
jgi:hypothetical protein